MNLIEKLSQHGRVWALEPKWLARQIAREDADGTQPSQSRRGSLPRVKGSVAVLGLQGLLTPKWGWLTGTSTVAFGRAFDAVMGNKDIGAVVIDVDSPGGLSWGTQELSDRIFSARGAKPIIAVANSQAASAGFWIPSAADKMFVTPSGEVGSVGVWTMHENVSGFLEQMGIEIELISAGKYKTENHPFGPLSEEGRAHLQASVDEDYAAFIDGLARNYGISASVVRKDFGEGRMLQAKAASRAGMVAGIDTLESVVHRLAGDVSRSGRRSRMDGEIQEWLCDVWAADLDGFDAGGEDDELAPDEIVEAGQHVEEQEEPQEVAPVKSGPPVEQLAAKRRRRERSYAVWT